MADLFLCDLLTSLLKYKNTQNVLCTGRPVPRVDQGPGGGLVNWLGGGGGDARHRRSVDLEGSGGMLLQKFLYKFH